MIKPVEEWAVRKMYESVNMDVDDEDKNLSLKGTKGHIGFERKNTQVVNLKTHEYDIYIGRAGKGKDGYFGNPHTLGYVFCEHCKSHHDREQSIAAFKKDFIVRIAKDLEFRRRVLEMKGKRLGCFCKPLKCHGDVYKEWLDSQPSVS